MPERDWRLLGPSPVSNEDGFLDFLNEVGICLWRPHPSMDFPNLAEKMQLADPDDIWNTWFWKDDLHIEKRLYYGKLLAGLPTFVSFGFLPFVLAALGDVDPYTMHERGVLSIQALRLYEALERYGELSTGALRRETGLVGPRSRAVFDRAMVSLQSLFLVCKTGLTGRTRGTYGYRWGLVERWIPETLRQAAGIAPTDAAREVAARLVSVGVRLSADQYRRLLGWSADTAEAALAGVCSQ